MEDLTEVTANDSEHLAVRIVRKGRLSVAVPLEEIEPLTEETVRRARDAVREGSDAALLNVLLAGEAAATSLPRAFDSNSSDSGRRQE